MGIQIANAFVKPSVTYDRIHMTKLEVVQPTQADDTATPTYQVMIFYRHYGIVDGVRYYKDEELNRATVDDFITLAMTKAAGGDMSLVSALQAIEVAVAAIISDQKNVVTTVV